MKTRQMTAIKLEEKSGVDNAKIGRILKGQLAIKPHDFISLVSNVSTDDIERAGLIAAYMRDWCVGPKGATAHIEIRVNKKQTDGAVRLPAMPPRIEEAISVILKELPTNKKVQSSILAIAEFLES